MIHILIPRVVHLVTYDMYLVQAPVGHVSHSAYGSMTGSLARTDDFLNKE
jgi:hypothetical protein